MGLPLPRAQAGCANVGLSFGNVTALRFQECMPLRQGLSEQPTGRPVVTISAPGLVGGAQNELSGRST